MQCLELQRNWGEPQRFHDSTVLEEPCNRLPTIDTIIFGDVAIREETGLLVWR